MKKCPSELELEAFIGSVDAAAAEQKPGHVAQFGAGVMFQAGCGDLSAFSFADSVSGNRRGRLPLCQLCEGVRISVVLLVIKTLCEFAVRTTCLIKFCGIRTLCYVNCDMPKSKIFTAIIK
jgi:hypothetical protein